MSNPYEPKAGQPLQWSVGISLRDYFAAAALDSFDIEKVVEAILDNGDRTELSLAEIAAKAAYTYADAMLKAREE